MSKVLLNPTNEDLSSFYNGLDVVIKRYPEDGCRKEVSDPCANHLITALGKRGLCVLQYGDHGEKEEAKAEAGRKRNLEFKKTQVIQHNRQNEDHKQTNRPYISPSDIVRKYAEELGLSLMEPYHVKDMQSEEMGTLRKQVAQLLETVAALTAQLSTFQSPSPIKEAAPDLIKENRKRYASLTKTTLPSFINNNLDEINAMPIENRLDIKMRWEELIKNEPFPDVIIMDD